MSDFNCPMRRGWARPQCNRGCRGFECKDREELRREKQRQALQPVEVTIVPNAINAWRRTTQPERCPWDDWRPARDLT